MALFSRRYAAFCGMHHTPNLPPYLDLNIIYCLLSERRSDRGKSEQLQEEFASPPGLGSL